jgi:ribosomal protein L11 methyltransferase
MMIQHLLEWAGMKTLDMGCGTAILAILAEMKGQPIDAIDIDRCYLNSIENAQRNNCKHITQFMKVKQHY